MMETLEQSPEQSIASQEIDTTSQEAIDAKFAAIVAEIDSISPEIKELAASEGFAYKTGGAADTGGGFGLLSPLSR